MNEIISIIMACYNCENTIDDAIKSILNQTYENWIMICCDDGSTDNTYKILKKYEGLYPQKFVVLKNGTNRKLPYSLNHCLKHVNTEYVARMDADDQSHPERLEKQLQFLLNHPEIDTVGTCMTVTDGKHIIGSIGAYEYPTKLTMLKANTFNHATIMTHKYVYDILGGYSLDPSVLRVEDVDLWCRFLAHGFKGYNLQEELYIVLEDESSPNRRKLSARWNSARTRHRGYKLMGFKGVVCFKPYLLVLKGFVPNWLYSIIHKRNLKKGVLKRKKCD